MPTFTPKQNLRTTRGEVTGGAKHFSAPRAGYENAAVNGYGYGYSFDAIGNQVHGIRRIAGF